MNKVKMLWLIRGLPGTGKSELAKLIRAGLWASRPEYDGGGPRCVNVEAHDYFNSDSGYAFDSTKIKESYDWCLDQTDAAMRGGVDNVFVTNPFTKLIHMADYERMADRYGYVVNVLTCHSFFDNVHDVPPATLRTMRSQLEYPQTRLPVA